VEGVLTFFLFHRIIFTMKIRVEIEVDDDPFKAKLFYDWMKSSVKRRALMENINIVIIRK